MELVEMIGIASLEGTTMRTRLMIIAGLAAMLMLANPASALPLAPVGAAGASDVVQVGHGNHGRHLGWSIGRHRGWSHSRHRMH